MLATLIILLPMVMFTASCVVLQKYCLRHNDPEHIGVVGRVFDPPDNLPPALAAWLVRSIEATPLRLFIATLLDLAQRGYLRIVCRRMNAQSRDQRVTFVRELQTTEALLPFERAVLNLVFDYGSPVKLVEAQFDIKAHWLLEAYEKELSARHLLDPDGKRRMRASNVRNGIAIGLGLSAVATTVWLSGGVQWWGWVLLGLWIIIGWTIADVGADIRGVNQRGADARAAWRGFALSLRKLSPEAVHEERFDKLLPYAVAFGLIKPFMEAYRDREVPLPRWYTLQIASIGAIVGDTIPLHRAMLPLSTVEEVDSLIKEMERLRLND